MAFASSFESRFSPTTGKSNPRVSAVFEQLLVRYEILIRVRRLELLWRSLFLLGCVVSLTLILVELAPSTEGLLIPVWLGMSILVYDGLVFGKYRQVQRKMQKATVNFGVIRHHLIGILEIELCQCQGDCSWLDEFRRAALRTYGISLY